MLLYVLICLCLALAGIAGLQFTYTFYLDRLDRERKKRLHELEAACRRLSLRLEEAELRIARQDELLAVYYQDREEDEEAWADVLEDH